MSKDKKMSGDEKNKLQSEIDLLLDSITQKQRKVLDIVKSCGAKWPKMSEDSWPVVQVTRLNASILKRMRQIEKREAMLSA